jgi:hypothetical protein
LATASTSPVPTRIATRAAGFFAARRAASAAVWIVWSSVMVTGFPATAFSLNSASSLTSVATVVSVVGGTSDTVRPGLPASCSSYACCRPDRPVRSPARTRPSDLSTISFVAAPTVPIRARAKSALGASARLRCWNTAPGIGCSSSRTRW